MGCGHSGLFGGLRRRLWPDLLLQPGNEGRGRPLAATVWIDVRGVPPPQMMRARTDSTKMASTTTTNYLMSCGEALGTVFQTLQFSICMGASVLVVFRGRHTPRSPPAAIAPAALPVAPVAGAGMDRATGVENENAAKPIPATQSIWT